MEILAQISPPPYFRLTIQHMGMNQKLVIYPDMQKIRDYGLKPGDDVIARKRKVMEKFKLSETFL
jgi:hypothetical protein